MKLLPKKTALLVVDMQKDFYGVGGNADQRGKSLTNMRSLPSKIYPVIDQFRSMGVVIVFTKFLYDPEKSPQNYIDHMERVKNSNYMCRIGTDGADFEGVAPVDEDIVIEKYRYDAFANTDLAALLRSKGVETVLICGVQTEVCVFATASRAYSEGFNTVILSDLVATSDDITQLHDAVLSSANYFADVIPSNSLFD